MDVMPDTDPAGQGDAPATAMGTDSETESETAPERREAGSPAMALLGCVGGVDEC